MKIKIIELKDICTQILKAKGLSEDESLQIFNEYLDAELRGRSCRGFQAFAQFGAKMIDAQAKEEVLRDDASTIHINGNGKMGQLVCNQFVPKLIEKAKSNNIAMMGVFNMRSYLMPGTYARMAAENDLVGFIYNYGGAPRIAPTGSIDPVFATNPIAVGIPADPSFVIDMATSTISMMNIRLAEKLGIPIAPETCIDKDGKPTTDPKEAIDGALLPFGSHKGSALAMMVEILSRSMFNLGKPGENIGKRGFFFIFFNPAVFQDIDQFKSNVTELITTLKSSRKAENIDEIFYPGERSERTKRQNLTNDFIDIDEKILEEIRNLLAGEALMLSENTITLEEAKTIHDKKFGN